MEPALSAESTWKLSAHAPRPVIEAALLAHELVADWDAELVIAGRELAEDRPGDWVLEAWYPRKPGPEVIAAIERLFAGGAPPLAIEELPPADWVTLSQHTTPPIRAGRFHVHTPDFPPDPGLIDLVIPAAQAFGTGHHHTTAGCLEMLGHIRASGLIARRIADIGTGTGLLAFAARALWPTAQLTLTDIDPVCAGVVAANAEMNAVPLGPGPGAALMIVADGMADPLIALRAPFDLLIANILAGPLVEMAEDFGKAVRPGGSLLLAGLLAGAQEDAVCRAMRRAGFRPVARLQRGDWAILWLRRRRAARPA